MPLQTICQSPFRKTRSPRVLPGYHWMVTFGRVKYYSCLSELMHRLKLRPLLRVVLFTFPFYLVRDCCFHSTPHSEHWRQRADGFHAVGRAQLTVLSLIRSNNHKQKVKQTLFRTCAIFILSTLLRLGNSQWSQEIIWIRSTVILWDFHLSCLLWCSGPRSSIPSKSQMA